MCEKRWSANEVALILRKDQTLGVNSGHPLKLVGFMMSGSGMLWEWLWYVYVHIWELVRTLGAPGIFAKQTQKSQPKSERWLGYNCKLFRDLQVLRIWFRMYIRNELPLMANIIHGLLFIIPSESYLYCLVSSSTSNLFCRNFKKPKTKASHSPIKVGSLNKSHN